MSKNVVSIHQPNYFPWMGYFYKMLHSDVFVYYDNIQIEQRSQQAFVNRTKIKTSHGELWLTCPVHVRETRLICDVELVRVFNWRTKHLKTIYYNYRKSRYFRQIYPEVERLIENPANLLCDYNIAIIEWIKSYLEIDTETVKASAYNGKTGCPTDRIINILKQLDAGTYISGHGAKLYQDESMFRAANIELRYTNFQAKEYTQLYGEFVPKLSILDAIFNMGKDSISLLKKSENC